MPALPDDKHMDIVDRVCLEAVRSGFKVGAYELLENIFKCEELPMHCPYHHYVTAAVLVTSAGINASLEPEKITAMLKKARARASGIPGGICGECGCCGAAVGVGIFADLWLGISPMSKEGWAIGNKMTADALYSIASAEGPRCCKRVSYLALLSAVKDAHSIGAVIGQLPEKITCTHFKKNRECKGVLCPFFKKGGKV